MKFLTDFTYRNLHGFARFPGDSTALVYKCRPKRRDSRPRCCFIFDDFFSSVLFAHPLWATILFSQVFFSQFRYRPTIGFTVRFLPRDAMPSAVYATPIPSVRLSVTRVYCIKTAEHIIEILSLSDRPIILVFWHQAWLRKSEGVTTNGGAKYKRVAIFDQYAAISRKR